MWSEPDAPNISADAITTNLNNLIRGNVKYGVRKVLSLNRFCILSYSRRRWFTEGRSLESVIVLILFDLSEVLSFEGERSVGEDVILFTIFAIYGARNIH